MLTVKIKISEKKNLIFCRANCFKIGAATKVWSNIVKYRFFTLAVLCPNNKGLYSRWETDIFRVGVVEDKLFCPILCVHSIALRQANALVKLTHIHNRIDCKINAVDERHSVLAFLAERF
jgi:hypothetical protein